MSIMSPEQQRIAIAEACGWNLVDLPDHPNGHKVLWKKPNGEQLQSGAGYALPDYLNSLDAMHEAEKVLDVTNGGPSSGDCLRYAYCRELYRLTPEWEQPFRATAAQRAEAFLKTLGLWKE